VVDVNLVDAISLVVVVNLEDVVTHPLNNSSEKKEIINHRLI